MFYLFKPILLNVEHCQKAFAAFLLLLFLVFFSPSILAQPNNMQVSAEIVSGCSVKKGSFKTFNLNIDFGEHSALAAIAPTGSIRVDSEKINVQCNTQIPIYVRISKGLHVSAKNGKSIRNLAFGNSRLAYELFYRDSYISGDSYGIDKAIKFNMKSSLNQFSVPVYARLLPLNTQVNAGGHPTVGVYKDTVVMTFSW